MHHVFDFQVSVIEELQAKHFARIWIQHDRAAVVLNCVDYGLSAFWTGSRKLV